MNNIDKTSLPVVWRANPSAWVTLKVFQDWFDHHFIPEVKLYCQRSDIPFKILLVLDNAPGHPPDLDESNPDVKVVYLPPNTTSILQPMDQGVIANFKKYYLRRTYKMALKAVDSGFNITLREWWKKYDILKVVKNIDASWKEVTEVNLNSVWKALCPQFYNEFTGFDQSSVAKEIMNNLVELGNKLDLGVQEDDFQELLDSHDRDLSNEDLIELEAEQRRVPEDEEDGEPAHMKKFETKGLAKIFSLVDEAIELIDEMDPNVERSIKVANSMHDALTCYRIIYEEKKKKVQQPSIDQFFRPKSTTTESTDTSRASTSGIRLHNASSTCTRLDSDSEDEDDPLPVM